MAKFLPRLLTGLLLICAVATHAARTQTRGARQGARPPAAKPSSAAFDEINARATAAREAGQLNEAVEHYRRAVALRPAWAEGWWYLGTLLYEMDRYAEAREPFRRFVALEPKGGAAWALLGLCDFQVRDYERALANIQRGRTLGLGDSEHLTFVTRYHAAVLLTRFEQYELALEILTYFARTLPSENPLVVEALGLGILRLPLLPSEVPAEKREMILKAGRGTYYQFSNRLDAARREYEELVARYGQVPNVHYAYGVFLLQDKPEAAIEEFKREIQVSPAHLAARLQIAFAYLNRHEAAAGRPFAEEAVKLAPNSFPARNALGRILLEAGDATGAVRELEAGVKLAPDSPEMYFALARAYGRAGRKAEAEKARARFVALDRLRRTQKEGPQSVGGTEQKTGEVAPD